MCSFLLTEGGWAEPTSRPSGHCVLLPGALPQPQLPTQSAPLKQPKQVPQMSHRAAEMPDQKPLKVDVESRGHRGGTREEGGRGLLPRPARPESTARPGAGAGSGTVGE